MTKVPPNVPTINGQYYDLMYSLWWMHGRVDQFGSTWFTFLLPKCDFNCHIMHIEIVKWISLWDYRPQYVHYAIDWYKKNLKL
jgi:hypothetical protein